MKSAFRNNWVKSLLINTVILVTLLLTVAVVYETNDDHSIARQIAAGYYNINFTNYYMCRAVGILQKLTGEWNAFVIAQIGVSFAALTTMLKVMLDRCNDIGFRILTVAATAMIALDHYNKIQFSKTSALLVTIGLLFIVDTALNKESKARYAWGIVLFLTGAAFRANSMLPSIAYCIFFLALAAFWFLISRKKSEKHVDIRMAVSVILMICVAYGMGTVSYNLSKNMNQSSPQLELARQYSSDRFKITDYPITNTYKNHKAEMDAIGVDANDLYLMKRWMFDYDGAASPERLSKVADLNVSETKSITPVLAAKRFMSRTLKYLRGFTFEGLHLMLLCIIALYALVVLKPKYYLNILGFAGLTAAVHIALFYMQRVNYRAFYVPDIAAIVWILYTLATAERRNIKPKTGAVMGIVTAILIGFTGVSMAGLINETSIISASKTRSSEFDKYFEEHSENLYICEVAGWNNTWTYAQPLKVTSDGGGNNASVGGWSTLMPSSMDQLKAYGIDNPISGLVDNDHVLYIGNTNISRLNEYFTKWYGDDSHDVRLEYCDEVAGKKVWKVRTISK